MNNGKKTLLRIILFLVLFIPSYLAIYNIRIISIDKPTVENTTKVEILDQNGTVLAEYTTNADIKNYIRTLDGAQPIEKASGPLGPPLILKFYKGDKTFTYGMYLSLDNMNNCIIKTSDDELLHMKPADAEMILNTTVADVLYPNNTIPAARLAQGDGFINVYPKSGGEWQIKKPNGNFYPSKAPGLIKESNKVKAYQDREFAMEFDIWPDELKVEVIDNKEVIFSDIYSNFVANFRYDATKELEYVLTAKWSRNEADDYFGSATYVLAVKYYTPVKFDISQLEAEPGGIVAITAHNMGADEDLVLTTDMGYETKFVTFGANRVALVPISPDIAGRTVELTVTSDIDEPRVYHLIVNEKTPGSKAIGAERPMADKHLDESAQAIKQERYNAIFAVESANEKYWTEKFALPREGKIWIEYGWKVTVNGKYTYFNKGVNLDIDQKDPVKASNGGRVIFVGEVPENGNLIVIDHGLGIKTWYAHMGKVEVSVGDAVYKGQQIGTMDGYTGLWSNLLYNMYFAVSVNNIFVNPVPVVEKGIPGIDILSVIGGDPDMPSAAATDMVN